MPSKGRSLGPLVPGLKTKSIRSSWRIEGPGISLFEELTLGHTRYIYHQRTPNTRGSKVPIISFSYGSLLTMVGEVFILSP